MARTLAPATENSAYNMSTIHTSPSAKLNISRGVKQHGNNIDPNATVLEALAQADQSHTLGRMPLHCRVNGSLFKVDDANAIWRLDAQGKPERFLVTVGPNTVPLQPLGNAELLQALAGEGARWANGGTIGGGIKTFLEMIVGEVVIAGDVIQGRLVLTDGCDGKTAQKILQYELRPACWNGMTNWSEAGELFRTTHTKNAVNKQLWAKNAVQNELQRLELLKRMAENMLKIPFGEERYTGLIEALVPMPEDMSTRARNQAQETRSLFWQALSATDLANVVGTGWGAFQAVSDVASHIKRNTDSVDRVLERHLANIGGNMPYLAQAKELILASN